ncbi:hypothetical protein DEI93_03300 [Curtobacterium sp. MCBD17_035]|uniref:hypothetical protein n=1 Tax=Curtobacterium sp. MCBD17_035 TaxID=2175673 RepID=UPI000DAAC72F|nr:hypothetical protein [Curtobacterium sp. MCBD17_035]WIB68084.1 hypothetical protein DEI93_03300 [Curtobacterium sp. MCBD17_035]
MTIINRNNAIRRLDVPLDDIDDEIEAGDFVFATQMDDGPTNYSVEPLLDIFRRCLAGTERALMDGRYVRFLGVFYVRSIESGVAHLENGSRVACTEYQWCTGHVMEGPLSIDEGETEMHTGEYEKPVTLLGAPVEIARIANGGTLGHAISIELDAEVGSEELLQLAGDLDRLSAHLRSLVGEPSTPAEWVAARKGSAQR